MNDAHSARAYFPRGMLQPAGGYRFSLDPLLLACFARPKKRARLLDLGAGCGVAGLTALLVHAGQEIAVVGADIDPAQVDAARHNAARLGLAQAYQALELDVRAIKSRLAPESFGLVLANPPYKRLGTGRACDSPARTTARFEAEAGLEDFVLGAAFALANRGTFAAVFPAGRLHELLACCQAARLSPKRLRLVHSRVDQKAGLALVAAVKNAGSQLTVEPPLILYQTGQDFARLHPDALAFCPFLGAGRTEPPCPAQDATPKDPFQKDYPTSSAPTTQEAGPED